VSGLSFVPADTTGHIAVPQPGSWISKDGTAPASPPLAVEHPISARCKICGGRITLLHALQLEWRHESGQSAS
jgi:hypothetical protein